MDNIILENCGHILDIEIIHNVKRAISFLKNGNIHGQCLHLKAYISI